MGEAIDLTDCRNCYCLAARRVARSITRVYDEKLRPHGLRPTQFSILATLTRSRVRVAGAECWQTARPMPLQQRALDLLEVSAPA